jgi:hypothetical protein
MQKLDSSFSPYVPKQVTKEQLDKLFENAQPHYQRARTILKQKPKW